MNSIEKEKWVREQLLDCFENPSVTSRFVIQKREKLNGKIYKYCPILDDITDDNGKVQHQQQYAIENIENSILYMSRIKNFNDPFDSYVSFSMEAIISKIVAKSLSIKEFDSSMFEGVLPLLVEGILTDGYVDDEQSSNSNYLLELIEASPEFLEGGNLTDEQKTVGVMKMIGKVLQDGISGKAEVNNLTDAYSSDPALLISEILRVAISHPQEFGVQTELMDLEQMKEATKELKAQMDDLRPDISEAIKKNRDTINNTYYVACFSTTFDNALMWAHYANKHKGFCVEYDLGQAKIDDDLLINLFPVIYSQKRAMVPDSLFDYSDIENMKVSTNDISTVDLILSLLQKSDVWQYEDEWRLILYDEIEKLKNNKYSVDCISKIILGCSIEPYYKNRLVELCQAKKIKLSKMQLAETEYKLIEIPILE
ncbi:MAG: DUF2971 domain-containing protein [Christensenella sp.]|uniref:DUF2971 domain-containing protein n=1 Tax=Christensenella sp. TaxID=1935934 RepID=UPI002B21F0D2|nr:DUF2971 domain-containing protein [Christensenella sp.]MEA5002943.1 DUF2971 domain-containing protein [Christensenella sp.]